MSVAGAEPETREPVLARLVDVPAVNYSGATGDTDNGTGTILESSQTDTATGGPGIVGRQGELAILLGALDAARDGDGSIVLIAGEPGIGKTTLADELALQARERGFTTVWGRCWDGGGAPAYWAWRQVVRTLAEDFGDDELVAAAGIDGRWLTKIAPELDARLPGEDPVEPEESDQARFVLYDALGAFLRASAARAPLVVLLDDLHASDVASLRALNFVARAAADLPLLVVGTLQEVPLRARPEAAVLVEGLDRSGERIELSGLDAHDLGELLGPDVPAAVLRQVYDRSGGNPLFATELARVVGADGDAAQLPGGVQTMINDRVSALGADGVRILTAVAVIGQEFRVPTAEAVAGIDRATLLDLLEDAEGLGIVHADPATGRYRFRHGLIRDALYQTLRRAERAQAHRRVGEVLRELYPDNSQERHLAELAHHFVEAATLGDAGPAVHYSRRAGERAMAVFAFEQAADHLVAALRAIELGSADDATRAQLLLELGRARSAAGHPDAEPTLIAAAELARTLGDATLLADVALAIGPYALSPGTVDDTWVGLLEEAITALGEHDQARRARLLAELGRALYYAPGAGERRLQLADDAVTLARSTGDPHTLAAALSDAHVATWGPDRTHENLQLITELQALLDDLGDPRAGLPALVRSIDLHLELGDIVAADFALQRLETRAAELRDVRAQVLAKLHRSRMAVVEGRFTDVPALLTEAAERGHALRYSPVGIIVGGQMFAIRLLRGGLADFEPALRQWAEMMPNMPAWRAALALAHVQAGRDVDAAMEVDRMAAGAFARVERDNLFLLTIGMYGQVAWRIGAVQHAPVLQELLTPFADRMLSSTGGVFLGPVERILGQLAALSGDHDAALAHLARARDTARLMGAAPSVVLTDIDEAAIRVDAGDLDGARVLLQEIGPAAQVLGMAPVLERVEALSAVAGGHARAAAPAATPAASAGRGLGGGGVTQGRLVREGDTWALELGQRAVRLRDAKGVQHLAVLLANPGVEVHALDLVAGGGDRGDVSASSAIQAGLSVGSDGGDTGPLLDEAAKRAYRERILDLRETVEEAERFNDPERAAQAREELDAIAAQLSSAMGLGGRDRTTGSAAERARVNVTRALRSTLRRIAEHDPDLGADLEACVRTGTLCSYEPPALHPVTWEVDGG